jgi:hypothetical protein
MVTMTPQAVVQGADRTPNPYGLFSTFTFRPQGDDRWEGGGVTFEMLSCASALGIGPYQCGGATSGLPLPLLASDDAVGGTFGQALPFYAYGHFHCSPVGWTPEQAQARAQEHLLAMEQKFVENTFWTGGLALGNYPSLQSATPSPTTLVTSAATFVEVLALLENFIANNYGSQGVIHMTRGAALVAAAYGALETANGRLVTKVGTPVAAGTGYPGTGPAGEVPAAHTSWIYATPALFGFRGEVFDMSNTPGDNFVRGTNDVLAVAARPYLLGYDPCGVAAALATLTAV